MIDTPEVSHPLSARLCVIAGILLIVGSSGCADQTEPLRSPVLTRRFGGDSIEPGAVISVCKPDDVGCVPVGAVACPAPPGLDTMPGATVTTAALSPEEEAWCAAHAPTQ